MFIADFQGNSCITYLIDVNVQARPGEVTYPDDTAMNDLARLDIGWFVLTLMLSLFTECSGKPGRLLLSFTVFFVL